MSEPIGPGDAVGCVAGAARRAFSNDQLVEGKVYVVRKLATISDCRFCGAGIEDGLIVDTDVEDDVDGWCAARFRPLKRRDEAFLQSLLQPLPAEPVTEAA